MSTCSTANSSRSATTFQNTTGAATPDWIQRTSLLNALRTRDTTGTGGVTLAANAPEALTPLYQSLMSQRPSADEILYMLETACEKPLPPTDPGALTDAVDSSALALMTFGHDI